MTSGRTFVIASNVPEFDDPLLHNVNNLCVRLRIQQENIDKTEREIQDLLETILLKITVAISLITISQKTKTQIIKKLRQQIIMGKKIKKNH